MCHWDQILTFNLSVQKLAGHANTQTTLRYDRRDEKGSRAQAGADEWRLKGRGATCCRRRGRPGSLDPRGRRRNLRSLPREKRGMDSTRRWPTGESSRRHSRQTLYFGTGDLIPTEIEAGRKAAHESRMEMNRATSCPTCERFVSIAN